MKRKFQKFSILAVLVVFLFSFAPDIVESRRGFGGGRSFGRSRSFSRKHQSPKFHTEAFLQYPAKFDADDTQYR